VKAFRFTNHPIEKFIDVQVLTSYMVPDPPPDSIQKQRLVFCLNANQKERTLLWLNERDLWTQENKRLRSVVYVMRVDLVASWRVYSFILKSGTTLAEYSALGSNKLSRSVVYEFSSTAQTLCRSTKKIEPLDERLQYQHALYSGRKFFRYRKSGMSLIMACVPENRLDHRKKKSTKNHSPSPSR
jgi:hypothetical protein